MGYQPLFTCVFYLLVVTGSVAVTVVWKWMYSNYYGIFNYHQAKTLGLIDKNTSTGWAMSALSRLHHPDPAHTTSVGQPIVCTFRSGQ